MHHLVICAHTFSSMALTDASNILYTPSVFSLHADVPASGVLGLQVCCGPSTSKILIYDEKFSHSCKDHECMTPLFLASTPPTTSKDPFTANALALASSGDSVVQSDRQIWPSWTSCNVKVPSRVKVKSRIDEENELRMRR